MGMIRLVPLVVVSLLVCLVCLQSIRVSVVIVRNHDYRVTDAEELSYAPPFHAEPPQTTQRREEVTQPVLGHDTVSQKNAAHVPLVLVSRGCSGTTFLLDFAKKLVLRHTGLDPFVKFPSDNMTDEYLDLRKAKLTNSRYNLTLQASEGQFAASRQMVFTTYDIVSQNKSKIMLPKILIENLRHGVVKGLNQLQAKYVVTYRRNILGRTVCNVRDCFELRETKNKHVPMFENGTESNLCFERRLKSVNVVANIDKQVFSETMGALMKHGCEEGLRDPELKYKIDKIMVQVSGRRRWYPRLALEDLEAFEFAQYGTTDFNQSLAAWKMLLKGWDIEPQEELILEEMNLYGIGTRQRKNLMKNVYNRNEIETLFRDWANNESLCDWSWMTQEGKVRKKKGIPN